MENITKKENETPGTVEELKRLFHDNSDKRVCVVGSSCVGKSTLLDHFPNAIDMDDLLFGNEQKGLAPLLTQEEINYVCSPWTPEIGNFMTKKAKELIKIKPGQPVFGTIVFPSDLVVEITVPDDLLRERIRRRKANEQDVFAMKAQIEEEVNKSGIEKITLENI